MTLGNANKKTDDDQVDNQTPTSDVRRSDVKFLTPERTKYMDLLNALIV
jgi:hypothetical protein